MNKRLLKLLILLGLSLIFATSVVTLAACNDEVDPSEYVEGKGNTVKVTLDATYDPLIESVVGKVSNGYIDYRLQPGSPVPEPGKTKGTTAPTVAGYVFDGYYQGTVNDDGSVTFGDRWDFTTKVNEDVTLYGKWFIQYQIRIHYVVDGADSGQYEDVPVANNAEQVTAIKSTDPTWSGHTYMQMYSDPECTTELTVSPDQPFVHGCTQANTICHVYAEFIEGNWKLVKSANDMRSISSNTNLYLLDDIDLLNTDKEGNTIPTSISLPTDYQGVIEGNGYTISNLNFRRIGTTGTKKESNYSFGLFSRLIGATIRNVTFENCSVIGIVQQTRLADEYFYGFLAGMAENVTVADVNFVNCALNELEFDVIGGSYDEAAEREKIRQENFIVGDSLNCQITNVKIDGVDLDTSTDMSTIEALEPKSIQIKIC